jgi:hypothetical protein
MVQLLRLLCGALIGLIQSSARREAEILVLCHQINVLSEPIPMKPGRAARVDYEYERNGTANLFMLLAPLVHK